MAPTPVQQALFGDLQAKPEQPHPLIPALRRFREFGAQSLETRLMAGGRSMPVFTNEFWTSKQRAGHSLHEVSYRACFKPQLPAFFMQRLTQPGDLVYDPFAGRGTTLVEAALGGRVPLGCDVNPLSRVFTLPRLRPPSLAEVAERLASLDLSYSGELPEELLVFYHPETLAQICALRQYLLQRVETGDGVDDWIRMVAVNRLTGHSPGFFSVYTLPPNQAVTVDAQRKINDKRQQQPEPRRVKELILRKSRALLRGLDEKDRQALAAVQGQARLLTERAQDTPGMESDKVSLVVTSPPFLDVVQYADDNWLRCWFCGIDAPGVPISMYRKLEDWQTLMTLVFGELYRLLKPGGHIAFEVGEIRGGKVKLEEAVVPCGLQAGLQPVLVLINAQEFTKTANCWGVDNNRKGTNSNRVVLFRKP